MSQRLMEMGYKALNEALAGSGPDIGSRNIPNLVPKPNSLKDPLKPNYSPSMLNRRVRDFDDDFIGPSKDKSVVPYSMTDTAPIRHGDLGPGRETMNDINTRMHGIDKRSGLSGAGNKLGRTIGKSLSGLGKK